MITNAEYLEIKKFLKNVVEKATKEDLDAIKAYLLMKIEEMEKEEDGWNKEQEECKNE